MYTYVALDKRGRPITVVEAYCRTHAEALVFERLNQYGEEHRLQQWEDGGRRVVEVPPYMYIQE